MCLFWMLAEDGVDFAMFFCKYLDSFTRGNKIQSFFGDSNHVIFDACTRQDIGRFFSITFTDNISSAIIDIVAKFSFIEKILCYCKIRIKNYCKTNHKTSRGGNP